MRSQPRRAFAPGLSLWVFLAGYSVLPIQRSILSRPQQVPAAWPPIPSERNVTNAPESIVRMKPGKIVAHYRLFLERHSESRCDRLHVFRPEKIRFFGSFSRSRNAYGAQWLKLATPNTGGS